MANTYVQIYIHFIFVVQYREARIDPSWKGDLYQLMGRIAKNFNHKLISINGMPDHVHLLISMRPNQSISDLVQRIKGNSSKWINDNDLTAQRFRWQKGYAAFSYGKSNVPKLIDYISNQEQHHKKKSFQEEYREFLNAFEVEYEEEYLFQELE